MLLITRRVGEKIMVGDDVVVHVMEIVGNTVRVGIQAPRSVPVYREEIWHAVRDENRAAADARKQPQAQFILERLDLPRRGRLGQIQPCGRACKTGIVGDCDEGSEEPEVHSVIF